MQDVFGIAREMSCTMSEQVLHRAGDVLRDVKAILHGSRVIWRDAKKIAPSTGSQCFVNDSARLGSQSC
jgi:hypothetical protein